MKTVIILVLIYLTFRIIKSSVSVKTVHWPQEKENVRTEPPVKASEEMVFDPVCKSYIPAANSISVKTDDRVEYFCGEACKKKFIESLKGPRTV